MIEKKRAIKTVTVRMTEAEHKDLKRVAELRCESLSATVRDVIQKYVRDFIWGYEELEAIVARCKEPEEVRSFLRWQGIPIQSPGDVR